MKELLQVKFPGRHTRRQMLAYKNLIGMYTSGQPLGVSNRSWTGQKEKLGYDASEQDLSQSYRKFCTQMVLKSFPKWGKGTRSFYPHFTQSPDAGYTRKGHHLG